ncbi:hypothetical protein LINGRAHAP2_LOCUS4120 [Linum grandiflorum]
MNYAPSLSSYSCIQVHNYTHKPPFAYINNKISLWVIDLIHAEVQNTTDCDCVIATIHGILCHCMLESLKENCLELMHYHIHGFWRYLEYYKPPKVDRWEDQDVVDHNVFEGMFQQICDR